MSHVLVTGAGGLLGRQVCEAVQARGGRVSALVRRLPPAPASHTTWVQADLLRAETLAAPVFETVDAIVHCASNANAPAEDSAAMANLLGAARRVPHIVHVGIAGIEDAAGALAYYRVKLDCEAQLRASGRPHTIVRATQFHELINDVLHALQKGPLLLLPRLTFQPVDVQFVAGRLADRALAAPAGRVSDVHGPQTLTFEVMSRAWLKARHATRIRIPVPALGLLRGFAKLSRVEGEAGGIDWATWLASHAMKSGEPKP